MFKSFYFFLCDDGRTGWMGALRDVFILVIPCPLLLSPTPLSRLRHPDNSSAMFFFHLFSFIGGKVHCLTNISHHESCAGHSTWCALRSSSSSTAVGPPVSMCGQNNWHFVGQTDLGISKVCTCGFFRLQVAIGVWMGGSRRDFRR